MNLESRKYHLIERIVALQDETMLTRMEQILSENHPTTTIQKVVESATKENGIIQRRSVYKISDRPKVVTTKTATVEVAEPARVIQTQSESNSSLGKLQRLVRERALSNHALDI